MTKVKCLVSMVFAVPFWQLVPEHWPETKIYGKKQAEPDFPIDLKVKDDTGMSGSRTYQVNMPVMAGESTEAAQFVENLFAGIPGLVVYRLDVSGPNEELKLESDAVPSPVSTEVSVVCLVGQSQETTARIWDNFLAKDGCRFAVVESAGGACRIRLTKLIDLDLDGEEYRRVETDYLKNLVDQVFGSPSDVVVTWPDEQS